MNEVADTFLFEGYKIHFFLNNNEEKLWAELVAILSINDHNK